MHHIIIGNGIAGITAARFLRKLTNDTITVISKETKYAFSRTALMYIYMGHMRFEDTKLYEDWFWKKNRIDLLQDEVVRIDPEKNQIFLASDRSISYDNLILATGSRSNKFGWPGQDLERVRGLYSLQDLEYMEEHSEGLKRAVIVGGGLIGIEMAEMFATRDIPVTMLVREQSYWSNALPPEESAMVGRHILEHHIDLRLGVNLGRIIDDGQGRAQAVQVQETGEIIECGYVGLTAGVSPSVDFVRDSGIDINRGVVVNEYLQTNHPNVYAIGDCAEIKNPRPGRRPIEALWYTGRMMGETVAYTISGKKMAYDPGLWFNSAKFFDIEYQVYGEMPSRLADHMDTLYWEHPSGKKAIRLVYDKESTAILGFNLMGVRYRQEVCHKWIKEGTLLEDVLQDLALANFDPEFYKEYESEIRKLYTQKTGKIVTSRQKRKLNSVLRFLQSV